MPQDSPIPFDILENIIDILAADDDENSTFLKPCALICRSLLHRSRKHIFRTIIIGLPTNLTDERPILFSQMPSRLSRLMSRTPELADYVRVLKIGVGTGEKYYAKCKQLPSTLHRFKHVESLTLSARSASRTISVKILDWTDVRPPMQNAILSIIQLRTLHTLSLWKIIFPILQVKIGVNVRALHTADVDFFELDDEGSQAGLEPQHVVQPIPLHSYTMGYDCGAQLTILLEAMRSDGRPVFDFHHLRDFNAECHFLPRDFDVVQSVIKSTAHLTTLFLTINCYATTALSVLLRGLSDKTLRTLKKITVHRPVMHGCNGTPMAGLNEGLEAMSRFPNVLEELTYSERLLLEDLRYSGRAELEKIDAILGTGIWPCLKAVSLGFTVRHRYGPASAKQVETALRQQHLPILSSRENLSLSFLIIDDT